MIANDMDHWRIQVSDKKIEVIRREVAAANQQVDFW